MLIMKKFLKWFNPLGLSVVPNQELGASFFYFTLKSFHSIFSRTSNHRACGSFGLQYRSLTKYKPSLQKEEEISELIFGFYLLLHQVSSFPTEFKVSEYTEANFPYVEQKNKSGSLIKKILIRITSSPILDSDVRNISLRK